MFAGDSGLLPLSAMILPGIVISVKLPGIDSRVKESRVDRVDRLRKAVFSLIYISLKALVIVFFARMHTQTDDHYVLSGWEQAMEFKQRPRNELIFMHSLGILTVRRLPGERPGSYSWFKIQGSMTVAISSPHPAFLNRHTHIEPVFP